MHFERVVYVSFSRFGLVVVGELKTSPTTDLDLLCPTYLFLFALQLKGGQTLGENIADNGGIKQAFQVL